MNRLGNSVIKRIALSTIRNFSLKSSIGIVLLNSSDFNQTIDAILVDSGDAQEKLLILQTLLSLASKGDQQLSKLKNSSLNRKLKEQISMMENDAKFQQNPENSAILQLTAMLSQILYQKNVMNT